MLTQLTVVFEDTPYTFGAHEVHDVLEDATTAALAGMEAPAGTGKADDPYTPTEMRHWLWAMQQSGGSPIVFYGIGGRRVFHRRGDNYLGDGGRVTKAPVARVQGLAVIPEGTLAEGGAWRRENGNPMAPTYTEVLTAMGELGGNALSSKGVATKIRALMGGGQLADGEHLTHYMLPSLIAAIFIGEPARNYSCLATHLMMLDILERGVAYSAAGLTATTWQEVLWNPDGMGARNDAYGKEYPPNEIGGLMPAGHKGSFDSQKQTIVGTVANSDKETIGYATMPKLRAGFTMTVVEQKEASLLIRWLARKIEVTPACGLSTPAFEARALAKAATVPELMGQRTVVPSMGKRRDVENALQVLIAARLANLTCQL
jgi:hypothetical protein